MEEIYDFSNLDKNHELVGNKNKKLIGFFEIETPGNIWIDEFVCLGSKMYAFKGGDESKNEVKGFSKPQSKLLKFAEFLIVYLVENIKKIVITILFDQLIVKSIFNE